MSVEMAGVTSWGTRAGGLWGKVFLEKFLGTSGKGGAAEWEPGKLEPVSSLRPADGVLAHHLAVAKV